MTHEVMLSRLGAAGVVAVVRAPSVAAAVAVVDALVAGGVTAIELTFTIPGAAEALKRVRDTYGTAVLLGAGTIRTPQDARAAAKEGASFLVSPGVVPAVVGAMLETGAFTLVGALTPSEVMLANDLGADAVKLFPASLGGPGYLRALRGPFPDVAWFPTGGVSPANLREWCDAGATAVGAGGELTPTQAVRSGDWERITGLARSFVAAVGEGGR
jgi:2-dehydro-3-deoxyphosphogluconate aldolase/(4S)-4-hydroxy-2-oxoglutarate aldolase